MILLFFKLNTNFYSSKIVSDIRNDWVVKVRLVYRGISLYVSHKIFLHAHSFKCNIINATLKLLSNAALGLVVLILLQICSSTIMSNELQKCLNTKKNFQWTLQIYLTLFVGPKLIYTNFLSYSRLCLFPLRLWKAK